MLVINLLGQRDFLLYYCTMSRIAVVGKFDPGATIFLDLPSAIGSPIALSTILEPVRDLSKGESGLFGQGFLLVRRWVPVEFVSFLQRISRLFFKAVYCFLTIPDIAR